MLRTDKKVEAALINQRQCPYASRIEGELRNGFQTGYGQDDDISVGASDGRCVNGAHWPAHGEKNCRQPLEFGSHRSAFTWFPRDNTVVHGDQCAVVCRETSDNCTLIHGVNEVLEVHLTFSHPTGESESEHQYISSFLFSFFHFR